MEKQKYIAKIQQVLSLLLFALFAGAVLLVLLFGVRSYQALARRGDAAFDQRTCMQYIAAKVRHSDSGDNVFVSDFSKSWDIPTLYLAQNIDGETYFTRIYYYNGYVYELFSQASDEMEPGDGSGILVSSGLDFSMEGKELKIFVSGANGGTDTLTLAIRSSGEAMG